MTAPIARSNSPLPPSEINSAKRLAEKPAPDPDLVAAAKGMEAMFLDHLMQEMRKTVPKSSLGLDSTATEVYQSMLDSEYANISAQAGGVGLAELIVDYMQSQRYNQSNPKGHEIDQKTGIKSTGGTYEGESIKR